VQAKNFNQQIFVSSHGQFVELYWMKDGRNLPIDNLPFLNPLAKVPVRLP
jgi:hypothetical protein